MKIAVIGSNGYVGSAAVKFFGRGYEVVAYDISDNMQYPKASIDECGLAVICVPTPQAEDNSCDTSIVEAALTLIDTPLVMIKSTIAPGTTDRLKSKTGKRIVFSPEYIGESKYYNPVYKTMAETNFHIVGGERADVEATFQVIEKVAGPYCTYYGCSAVEAEIIKYMENSFLAMRVSFVNQFYDIAKTFGADWHKVREGWLLDERIGRAFTTVFVDERGYGGKCLPKDTAAIVKACEDAGYDAELLRAMLIFNRKLRE